LGDEQSPTGGRRRQSLWQEAKPGVVATVVGGLIVAAILAVVGLGGEEKDEQPPEPPAVVVDAAQLGEVVRRHYGHLLDGDLAAARELRTADAIHAPTADSAALVDVFPGALTASADGKRVTFSPWIEVEEGEGCFLYEQAEFGLRRAGGEWRIARFPRPDRSANHCRCPDMPWSRTPTGRNSSNPHPPPGRALRLVPPEALGPLKVFAATSQDWGAALGEDGALDWGQTPGPAKGKSIQIQFERPTRIKCLEVEVDGPPRPSHVTATTDPSADTSRLPQRKLPVPYRGGRHWVRHDFPETRTLTLHVDGVEPQGARELPYMEVHVYEDAG